MPRVTVIDFNLDERAEDTMWEHGITPDELYETTHSMTTSGS